MIFWRVNSLDAILATAEKKSLHRTLGAWQLTLLGIGAIIGTGTFVLTAEAAQKGRTWHGAFVCHCQFCLYRRSTLLFRTVFHGARFRVCLYLFSYAVLGELVAWLVGWALMLEYSVAASAVAVGWSGYFVGLMQNSLGVEIPFALANGPFAGGIINLPAVFICILVIALLVIGTRESATFNATLVAIKIAALTLFIALTLPVC